MTDDISQSLLTLDKVINEYDPYKLNFNENRNAPLAHAESRTSGGDTSGTDSFGNCQNDQPEEIRKSLEALDNVLDEFDDNDIPEFADPDSHEGHAQGHIESIKTGDLDGLPLPPQGLLRHGVGGQSQDIDSATGTELYSRSSKRSGRPPQVPKRNPETRLSSGSTESQELDLSQFQYDDGRQGYSLTHQSSQEYSPKHSYHGYMGDPYSPPPAARNGGNNNFHGQSMAGVPPPASSLPPGGLPPPLPPARGTVSSGASMPGYPAPHYPPHDPSNGLRSLSPPPPPPGFDMETTVTSPSSSVISQQEELYETRLPSRMDELPAQFLNQQHGGGGEFENYYGSHLPPAAPGGMLHAGVDNGYPAPHELYETTLPKPTAIPPPPPPSSMPSSSSSSILRRSSSSSSSSYHSHHSHTQSSYSSGGKETMLAQDYNMGSVMPGRNISPDTDFPPPPPPQFFQQVPSAPSSMPGSPQRPPPPTLPKPNKAGASNQAGRPTHFTSPPNGAPPPPPPLSSMPRANNFYNHQQGVGGQYGAPSPPPPPGTLPPNLQQDSENLAAQLSRINLRTTSPPEDRLTGSPLVNAHSDLISQIHIGVTLRKSPAGKKIRGVDEVRADDSGDTFSETASVASSGSGEDNSSSSTGSRPPPPTLPKPNKPSPIHTSTMPSGGSINANNMSTMSDDIDTSDVGYQESDIKDVTQVDGYTPIPDGCPEWKRAMLERKNNQLLEQVKKVKAEKEKEMEKWRGVPEWKKALIMEREKKKEDEQGPQEEELRRRKEEEMRLQSMPEWKRALYIKKKGDI